MSTVGGGDVDGNMRDQFGQVGGQNEEDNNERDTLIRWRRGISVLGRNQVPGKLPGIHNDNPSYDS